MNCVYRASIAPVRGRPINWTTMVPPTNGPVASVTAAIRAAARGVDRAIPVYRVLPMRELVFQHM